VRNGNQIFTRRNALVKKLTHHSSFVMLLFFIGTILFDGVAHQIAQDYVDLASLMMLYPLSKLGPYGYTVAGDVAAGCNGPCQQQWQQQPQQQQPYPLEHMSALGYLKSAVRRPTVIERWSPYEIAVFEAALAEYGKDFHKVQKEIGPSKTTKDVIEFYYIWKKTSHYNTWKLEYVPEYLDVMENEGDAKLIPKR
jgi:hypothetical protein